MNVDGEEKAINQKPAEAASTIELQSLICQEELDIALNEDSDLVGEERAESHQLDEGLSNPIVSSMDIDEDDATGTEKVYILTFAYFLAHIIVICISLQPMSSSNPRECACIGSYRKLDLARAMAPSINLTRMRK